MIGMHLYTMLLEEYSLDCSATMTMEKSMFYCNIRCLLDNYINFTLTETDVSVCMYVILANAEESQNNYSALQFVLVSSYTSCA